jgi:hypothetical protein
MWPNEIVIEIRWKPVWLGETRLEFRFHASRNLLHRNYEMRYFDCSSSKSDFLPDAFNLFSLFNESVIWQPESWWNISICYEWKSENRILNINYWKNQDAVNLIEKMFSQSVCSEIEWHQTLFKAVFETYFKTHCIFLQNFKMLTKIEIWSIFQLD